MAAVSLPNSPTHDPSPGGVLVQDSSFKPQIEKLLLPYRARRWFREDGEPPPEVLRDVVRAVL
jgi:hypothetical protein